MAGCWTAILAEGTAILWGGWHQGGAALPAAAVPAKQYKVTICSLQSPTHTHTHTYTHTHTQNTTAHTHYHT